MDLGFLLLKISCGKHEIKKYFEVVNVKPLESEGEVVGLINICYIEFGHRNANSL